MTYSAERAQGMAVEALTFVSGDQEMLGMFLASTGLQVADLRRAATEPGFELALLDFVIEDDARVVAFAQHAGLRPEEVARARIFLAGPGSHGWNVD